MDTSNKSIPVAEEKQCSICNMYSSSRGNDVIHFGDWLCSNELTVHYFCLLLSTNLPQRGKDNSGILGFLLRDIRKEIRTSIKRICIYCQKPRATIACIKCKNYFHLICGQSNECLFTFIDEFSSYCSNCIPLNEKETILMKCKPKNNTTRCYICMEYMCDYHPTRWIYGRCCSHGFAHTLCMKKYALNAGYYLRCVWCKNETFRQTVKMQGVFVPDREANWESEVGAYRDLHRGHKRCDMTQCLCPRGRDYVQKPKWTLILCSLCGSFGVHNPNCFPGMEKSTVKLKEFKCHTCSITERKVTLSNTQLCSEDKTVGDKDGMNNDLINQSLYVNKNSLQSSVNSADIQLHETPEFSDDSISSSVVTVIASQNTLSQSTPGASTIFSSLNRINNRAVSREATPLQQIELQPSLQEANKSINAFVTLEMYEFNENMDCLDKVLVRIDLNDSRFAGKTISEIRESVNLITETDIIERTGDLSILQDFEKLIDEFNLQASHK